MTESAGPEIAYRSTPEEYAWGQWAQLEDALLVGHVLAGHDLAFQILMERYTPKVVRHLYTRVNCPADAQDLLQEVFISAYRGLGRLRSPDHFRSWLMHIVQYKLVDYYRAKSRKPRLIAGEADPHEPEQPGLLERIPDPQADPAHQAHLAETRTIIMREIERLGRPFSEVLHLRLIEELTNEEVASRLGQSPIGVRMRMFRGLRRLRKALAKYGIGIK